jgi:carboxypeptidase PM20D1
MKKIGLTLAFFVLVTVGILTVRTSHFVSKQIQVSPANDIELDAALATERLSKAIQYMTISAPEAAASSGEEFSRLHDHLRTSFPTVHRALKREVVGDYSLLYSWQGGDSRLKPALLMGHMDVVPIDPSSERQWTNPPFSGRLADGYIWGRGALDDKASVLAILEAVEQLLKDDFRPQRTLYLAFGHDEEVGGRNGAGNIAALLRSRNVELEYVLDEGGAILDGMIPGLANPAALVGIAEKGYASLELTVTGAGGHASMPPIGTAIGILSQAIQKLENSPLPPRFTDASRQLFEFLGPELPLIKKLALANLWLFGAVVERQLAGSPMTNAMIRTTIAPTMFKSGLRENVLPTTARAVVNVRILPGDTVAAVVEQVRRTIHDSRIKVTLRDLILEPSPVSDVDSPSFKLIHRTIRQIKPQAIVAPALLIAATDSRHYAPLTRNIYRFLPLTLRAEDLGRFHGIDERVSVKDYEQAIRFYVQLIRNSNE